MISIDPANTPKLKLVLTLQGEKESVIKAKQLKTRAISSPVLALLNDISRRNDELMLLFLIHPFYRICKLLVFAE